MDKFSQLQLKAHGFDFDSNLVFTSAMIYLLFKNSGKWEPISVTQEEFDHIKVDDTTYRYVENNPDISMREFREHGKYIHSLIDALDNQRFGPVWPKFKEATIQANPLAIITARGQPMSELQDGHKRVIMETLNQGERELLVEHMRQKIRLFSMNSEKVIDLYLSKNLYLPLNSKEFIAKFPNAIHTNVAERKYIGFEHFVHHVQKIFGEYYPEIAGPTMKFSVGFSDDNSRYIQYLQDSIEQKLIYAFPYTKFVLYNTANPHCIKKIELLHPESGLN